MRPSDITLADIQIRDNIKISGVLKSQLCQRSTDLRMASARFKIVMLSF